jgi:hypothetical protein
MDTLVQKIFEKTSIEDVNLTWIEAIGDNQVFIEKGVIEEPPLLLQEVHCDAYLDGTLTGTDAVEMQKLVSHAIFLASNFWTWIPKPCWSNLNTEWQ